MSKNISAEQMTLQLYWKYLHPRTLDPKSIAITNFADVLQDQLDQKVTTLHKDFNSIR